MKKKDKDKNTVSITMSEQEIEALKYLKKQTAMLNEEEIKFLHKRIELANSKNCLDILVELLMQGRTEHAKAYIAIMKEKE